MRKYIEKCEATVANAHGQIASLKAEVRVAREEAAMHKERAAAVKSAADAEAGERLQLALQQQKLSFQERMQVRKVFCVGAFLLYMYRCHVYMLCAHPLLYICDT